MSDGQLDAIIGAAAAGSVVLVLAAILLGYCILRRRTRRRSASARVTVLSAFGFRLLAPSPHSMIELHRRIAPYTRSASEGAQTKSRIVPRDLATSPRPVLVREAAPLPSSDREPPVVRGFHRHSHDRNISRGAAFCQRRDDVATLREEPSLFRLRYGERVTDGPESWAHYTNQTRTCAHDFDEAAGPYRRGAGTRGHGRAGSRLGTEDCRFCNCTPSLYTQMKDRRTCLGLCGRCIVSCTDTIVVITLVIIITRL